MATKKTAAKKAATKKPAVNRIGRPPSDGPIRDDRLSMRTYPYVVAKAKKVGTAAVEQAIMAIKG